MTTKECNTCHAVLPEEAFAWKSKAQGKRHPKCKECQRAYTRDHYAAHSDAYKERTGERNRAVRANHDAIVAAVRDAGACACCGTPATQTRLVFVKSADYSGPSVHEAVTAKMSEKKLRLALTHSQLRCDACAFTRYADALKPFQFGNPGRNMNIANARG